MAAGADAGFLAEAAVLLGAAVVAVPAFKRLGLGSVLGYFAAGAAIGPQGLAIVKEAESVLGFAEFGIVLLLFVIGLELRPARLWRMRAEIFGLGLLQVIVTGAVLFGALMLAGFDWRAALLTGLALALSSTAFAVQILREKGDLSKPYGDRAFSILLFQDLAIVPLLALVALLAPYAGGETVGWRGVALALGAVASMIVAGVYLLQPLLTLVARARADEVFTAAALLVVILASLLMEHVGLSMAMGAFIAGVLLAETEFRHQLETDIEPFRGLLLGLFFMGFGMIVDWDLVIESWWVVLGGAAGLFALKGVLLYGLARLFGSPPADARRIAATLGQGGEFAFVLLAAASSAFLLDAEGASLISALVTASMALTPIAVLVADRLAVDKEGEDASGMDDASKAPRARIIIAGFGRVGQVVARIMRLRGYDVTLIDNSPRRIRMAGTFGNKVYYGDARRVDVLKSAGAEQADIIFLCIDDRDGARHAVEKIKEVFPRPAIFADTYDRFSEIDIREAGADEVVRETFESAVELGRRALHHLGDGKVAEDVIEEFRKRDAELTRLQAEFGAEGGLQRLRDRYSLSGPV